jgi:predicted DNA-binding transcriptional regulator AlpA
VTIADLKNHIDEGFEQILKALMIHHDTVLDIDGLCKLTGLPKSTVYQKTCSLGGRPPELPHFRKGKRLYFLRSEINTWLTHRHVRTQEQLTEAAANLASSPTSRSRRAQP